MPQNQAFDSKHYERLAFPYNLSENALVDEPRFVAGSENIWITPAGEAKKRPGTVGYTNGSLGAGYRVDRIWEYETIGNPPRKYLLASVYKTAATDWELWYLRLDGSSSWTLLSSGNVRSCNDSVEPHHFTSSRGVAFLRGRNNAAKLSGITYNGDSGNVDYWGLPAPTTPARIRGAVGRLSAGISPTDLTLTLTNTSGADWPDAVTGVPFLIQIGDEYMQVSTYTPNDNVGPWTFTILTRGYYFTTAAFHNAGDLVVFPNFFIGTNYAFYVLHGWGYAYAWEDRVGVISALSPIEEDPTLNPSFTGPDQDFIPIINVQGQADTTRIPYVTIYRTGDGGGVFRRLDQIANTGAGSIEYRDNQNVTAYDFPIEDSTLDQATLAPTIFSNTPPTEVNAPGVTGVTNPEKKTPIATFSGRHFYAIGSFIYFSGDEEIPDGVPEHAFPSGTRRGNFFRIADPVRNLIAGKNVLWVVSAKGLYQITGSSKETLNIRQLAQNTGQPYGHERAMVAWGSRAAYLGADYRIMLVTEGEEEPEALSDALGSDVSDAIAAGGEADLAYYSDKNREYLVVAVHNAADPTLSKQWVLDIRRSRLGSHGPASSYFWMAPWSIPSVAMVTAAVSETNARRRLMFVTHTTAAGSRVVYVDFDGTAAKDTLADASQSNFDYALVFSLFQVPAGNHVNMLRAPGFTPCVYHVAFDRLLHTADDDPTVEFYFDDLWSEPTPATEFEEPARHEEPKGYKTVICPVNQVAFRFAPKIFKTACGYQVTINNLTLTYTPESGA